MRRSPPPPDAVLRAFGATDPPVLLSGGMGQAWRSGDVVLKPSSEPPAWCEWQARVLAAAAHTDRVRVQRVRTARDGSHAVDGWVAREFVDGTHRPRRWREVIDAGDAFHAVLADLPDQVTRPPADVRTDVWAVADRVAWGDVAVPTAPGFDDPGLVELFAARAPVAEPGQLVHGDLTGNVLFADGVAPAIIDFSPYWRPTAYAVGVVVADAVMWEGSDLELLARVADRPAMGQCLVRALIFRHVTSLLLPGPLPAGDAAVRYAALRAAAIALA